MSIRQIAEVTTLFLLLGGCDGQTTSISQQDALTATTDTDSPNLHDAAAPATDDGTSDLPRSGADMASKPDAQGDLDAGPDAGPPDLDALPPKPDARPDGSDVLPPEPDALIPEPDAGPVLDDQDGDGVPDVFDNCVDVPNREQADLDRDHAGDACDPRPAIRDFRLGRQTLLFFGGRGSGAGHTSRAAGSAARGRQGGSGHGANGGSSP